MDANTPPFAPKEIDVRIARIYRRDDGIVCVQAKNNVDINIEDSRESYEAVLKIANGVKIPILSLTGSGGTISTEVQKDWISKRKENIVLVEAVVAKSLAHKLIVNFIVNFYDVGRPMKLFTDKAKAVRWLKRRMEREEKLVETP